MRTCVCVCVCVSGVRFVWVGGCQWCAFVYACGVCGGVAWGVHVCGGLLGVWGWGGGGVNGVLLCVCVCVCVCVWCRLE